MARICPILPAGDSVREVLPIDESLVLDIQRLLVAAGLDPGPLDGRYGPRTASALAAFQDAHPGETGIDRALEAAVDSRFRYASCATLNALGVECSRVTCDPQVWAPVLGSEMGALALCAAVAAAADRGIISLSCPLPEPKPVRAPGWVAWVTAGAGLLGPFVIVGVLSALKGR